MLKHLITCLVLAFYFGNSQKQQLKVGHVYKASNAYTNWTNAKFLNFTNGVNVRFLGAYLGSDSNNWPFINFDVIDSPYTAHSG